MHNYIGQTFEKSLACYGAVGSLCIHQWGSEH